MTCKIFGIGFQKTGTTSLKFALMELGYRVKGGGLELVPSIMKGEMAPVWEVVDAWEAFEDHPWPNLFRELDARYPGSKFILTERDEESWLKSVVNHLGVLPDLTQKYTYGVGFPVGFEDVYLDRYRQHNLDVRAYFKDRPGDLLIWNLQEDAGWETLCAFLGDPIPDAPFPHLNKRRYGRAKALLNKIAARTIGLLRRK